MNSSRRIGSGFTLLEMLVTIVVLGIVLAVAMPSVKRYLESQRLRSIAGELSNDLQFARSEAVVRKQMVGVRLDKAADDTSTCYTVAAYTGTNCTAGVAPTCDCKLGAGAACGGEWVEIKTVVVPASTGVKVNFEGSGAGAKKAIAFDPTSGQISYCASNLAGGFPPSFNINTVGTSAGSLRTQIGPAGRARTCVTSGSVWGMESC